MSTISLADTVPSPLPSPPLGFGQRPKRRGAGPARRLSPGKSRRSGSQHTRAHCRVSGAEFELSHAQSSAARTLDGLEPYRRARKDAIQGVSPDAAMAGFLNATIRSSRPIQSASWSSRAGQRRQVSPTTRYNSCIPCNGRIKLHRQREANRRAELTAVQFVKRSF